MKKRNSQNPSTLPNDTFFAKPPEKFRSNVTASRFATSYYRLLRVGTALIVVVSETTTVLGPEYSKFPNYWSLLNESWIQINYPPFCTRLKTLHFFFFFILKNEPVDISIRVKRSESNDLTFILNQIRRTLLYLFSCTNRPLQIVVYFITLDLICS